MDFDSMTVTQLKDIARANNLKNWSKLKKVDLIQFLIDNVPASRPPSRGRGATPRRRTPSPRRPSSPRPRSPSPRPPSPRPRSRSPSPRPPSRGRGSRRRSPTRPPSEPFGVARLKKQQCEKNLRKDVVAAAEDYGIAITKAGGKKKTIKELCAEIDAVIAQQPPMPIAATPPRTRTPSPVRGAVGPPIARMPRPPTPPITSYVPAGMVPKAIYYALTNIEIDDDYIPKAELLKSKVVSKPSLVRYAEELGIRGKSLTKEVLLDRIIAAKVAKDMPVVAQAIEGESSLIADEIADRVSERVSASGGQPPDQEEVQAVVEQRISTGESVSASAVADEIVAEQQSEDIIASTRPSSRRSSVRSSSVRSSSVRSSSVRPSSARSSSVRSSLPSRSSLSSQASSLMSRSSMSSSTRSSVASSVSVASNISNELAKAIVDEVADRTDRSSVRRTISEVVEEQGVNLDVDPDRLEEVVADEQAREAVESVVSRAADDGLISEDEEEEILRPLRDEAVAFPAAVPGPSGLGARPKVPRAQPQPIRRQIRGERDIEKLLREIQKPEESISNMPVIQHRVFRCLGIVN